ncbi:hypothetical protein ACA910_000518 [Epithemia clementina (nom. ined.)]
MPSPRAALTAKLWDRLEIEEDVEPNWYLLNCVAGLEMDLLQQCRDACANLPDAMKFVVPTEKKTRSHGANRMVTEDKVKYQGYVFAKLRLCSDVYETIQSLDLCRSWMGTVNQKGNRKLPPAPCPLNEIEIENFGLEGYEDEDEDENEDESNGVIFDTPDLKEKVDKEALKVYQGLEVENMVKVTARGKFFNEDGVVRRLKDGKILVRFYTYGSMYEEWMDPNDVRKLSSIEILKGLSGPSQPVTRNNFDRQQGGSSFNNDRRDSSVSDLRRTFMTGNNSAPRNRRQDRTERNFRQQRVHGRDDDDRRNWNWYQDQQRPKRTDDYRDGDVGMSPASRRRSQGGDWAIRNVDSQWGRNSPPPQRQRNNPRLDRRNLNHQKSNQQAMTAIEGKDDWSAFVSSSNSMSADYSSSTSDEDDFFSSLMGDLSRDETRSSRGGEDNSSGRTRNNSDDDDFFDSLLSDLKSKDKRSEGRKSSQKASATTSSSADDDDFFAALEAELGSAVGGNDNARASGGSDMTDDFFAQLEAELGTSQRAATADSTRLRPGNTQPTSSRAPIMKGRKERLQFEDGDDLFSGLVTQDSQSMKKKKNSDIQPSFTDDDDFFAALEADLAGASAQSAAPSSNSIDLDDIFAELDSNTKRIAPDSKAEDDNSFWNALADDTGRDDKMNNDKVGGARKKNPSPNSKNSRKSLVRDDVSSSPETVTVKTSSSSMSSSAPRAPEADLQKHTVPALKGMLRERGLKVSGKKAELIDRLMQATS